MVITKKLRFEIFERDGFTCQYCGKKPPDVILEVDHMVSKFNGGGDEKINLISSCFSCNRGKSKKSITTKQRSKSQRQELIKLKEKTAQLDAYYEYKGEASKLQNNIVAKIIQRWTDAGNGIESLTEHGVKSIASLTSKYTFEDIVESIDIAFNAVHITYENRFKYFCGILKTKQLEKDNPELYKRNKFGHQFKYKIIHKFGHINDRIYWKFITDGVPLNAIPDYYEDSSTWSQFKDRIFDEFYSPQI